MAAINVNKETGSLVNAILSNNKSIPVVGEGATVISYTDRMAYEVIEVSANGKRAIIQRYRPKRIDMNGMSDCQDYEYKELEEYKETIVFKWNAWRWECKVYIDNTKMEYPKVNIVFGVRDEYYDFSF